VLTPLCLPKKEIENQKGVGYTKSAKSVGSVQEISAAGQDGSRSTLIRAELDKILSSPVFAKSGRLSEFLRLIVENGLRVNAEPLKETVIGVQVYGRSVAYDPKVEPIVRIEARRLRLKLDEYYAGTGNADRVIITVPSGGYAPQFEIRAEAPAKIVVLPTHEEPPARAEGPSRIGGKWLTAGLVAVAFVGGLWAWLLYTRKPATVAEVPVTRLPGFEFQPSVSPDGKRVAFVWNGPDQNYDIYVKTLDDGKAFGPETRNAGY
jgi:hypothetical protein